ncbi:hypothetical protein BD410DRAFT_809011 [Rickenella mellea]|uniref:Uncharacterized protein n=1 Tax=Rickenella mellea TaxID=50990 RepID=A0A4Y7PJS9_9AGAM|nr:hypothetical protein BD410DRAFT_809011 [Rickenella mellea]
MDRVMFSISGHNGYNKDEQSSKHACGMFEFVHEVHGVKMKPLNCGDHEMAMKALGDVVRQRHLSPWVHHVIVYSGALYNGMHDSVPPMRRVVVTFEALTRKNPTQKSLMVCRRFPPFHRTVFASSLSIYAFRLTMFGYQCCNTSQPKRAQSIIWMSRSALDETRTLTNCSNSELLSPCAQTWESRRTVTIIWNMVSAGM